MRFTFFKSLNMSRRFATYLDGVFSEPGVTLSKVVASYASPISAQRGGAAPWMIQWSDKSPEIQDQTHEVELFDRTVFLGLSFERLATRHWQLGSQLEFSLMERCI